MIIKNMERDKYTSIIHEELNKLGAKIMKDSRENIYTTARKNQYLIFALRTCVNF